jgi:hypothetical protein
VRGKPLSKELLELKTPLYEAPNIEEFLKSVIYS